MRQKSRSFDPSSFVKEALRAEGREVFIEVSLVSVALLSTLVLFLFLMSHLYYTGFASFVDAQAGYITELTLKRTFPTAYWGGVYGLALRVPGFTEQLFKDVNQGSIVRSDIFFDCLQSDAPGGREIYASTSSLVDFNNLQPADLSQLDAFTGCGTREDCPSSTFTFNTSVMVGTTNITDVPATYAYKYDGDNDEFLFGVLNDSENLVFVAFIQDLQRGYSPNVTVNYQLILPMSENSSDTYYFFSDPNDVCPAGAGLGDNINATIWGYFFDEDAQPVPNVTASIAGYSGTTNDSGFYNISFIVVEGTYNLVGQKSGYIPTVSNVTINFSTYIIHQNHTLMEEINATADGESLSPVVLGYVLSGGVGVSDAEVYLAGSENTSTSNGSYILYPTVSSGEHMIVGVKLGYDVYYDFLNITNESTLYHNLSLTPSAQQFPFQTGPFDDGPYDERPGVQQKIIEAEKQGEDYWVSTREIKKEVRQNTFVEEEIGIYNFGTSSMSLTFSVSPELESFVELDTSALTIPGLEFGSLDVTIFGTPDLGVYNGTIFIRGDIERDVPVQIKIVEKKFPIETLLLDVSLFDSLARPGGLLRYKLLLQNLLRGQGYLVAMDVSVQDRNGSTTYVTETLSTELETTETLLEDLVIPSNMSDGDYQLVVTAKYLNYFVRSSVPFVIARPIYLYSFFGIPLWAIFALISFFSFILLNFFLYKKYQARKKRYKITVEYSTLPKPGDRVAKLGLVAETKNPAYYELERMTTHCIVAGATGMGKSISAQVIIEEALMNNIAVIVMDPTAQWSGMLRKCTDKKMMSFYPKFGLKETDSRAFKGNVRQVKDARQIIDISKFMEPGQIQIFSLNKLDPKDIDFFVANFIRQIFRNDPKESPNLKVLLVFDEVHRLLSKFGGSGQGFLQVERACREFRKWGLGVMLISQVLNDFVGEIKANINTEVQTRTIEEGDLERIKTKYGDDFLKSLIRAEVGVAMFQNAEYNRGRPYFINFRPILHNTRRLTDEELEKYNKYNDLVEDIEYQIEQLEKEEVDTFDLKMELKLVKDKIMTGNFSVVEIYLEGLTPRVEKEWEKLGKKPKKRELQLVDRGEVEAAVKEAQQAHDKAQQKDDRAAADAAAKEDKNKSKEAIEDKQVKALTFDNGVMVSSLKELKEALPTMDQDIFSTHVNKEKHDIGTWVTENFGEEEGKKISALLDKNEILKALEGIGKEEKPAPEKKADSGKKEGNASSEKKEATA